MFAVDDVVDVDVVVGDDVVVVVVVVGAVVVVVVVAGTVVVVVVVFTVVVAVWRVVLLVAPTTAPGTLEALGPVVGGIDVVVSTLAGVVSTGGTKLGARLVVVGLAMARLAGFADLRDPWNSVYPTAALNATTRMTAATAAMSRTGKRLEPSR